MSTPPGSSPVGQGQQQSYFWFGAMGNDDGSTTMRRLVDCSRAAYLLAEQAATEYEEKEKELQATKAEVAKLNQEHAAVIAKLNQEHAAEVAKLNEEHAAEIAHLKQLVEVEVRDAKMDMLQKMGSLHQEILTRLERGMKHRLEVFRSNETGWGVRAPDLIQPGAFLCEYTGDVVLLMDGQPGSAWMEHRPKQ